MVQSWSVILLVELIRRKEDGSLDETTRTAVGEYINYSGKYYAFTVRKNALTDSRWKQKRKEDIWNQL